MRAVIQRVSRAGVSVGDERVAAIGPGLLVLLGVATGDDRQAATYLAGKIAGLRIFEDTEGKMNLSVQDCSAGVLVVSQFTLLADCRKGRRPGFAAAAPPEEAAPLCEYFVDLLQQRGIRVQSGRFRAAMTVDLVNDGPVTILLDSEKVF